MSHDDNLTRLLGTVVKAELVDWDIQLTFADGRQVSLGIFHDCDNADLIVWDGIGPNPVGIARAAAAQAEREAWLTPERQAFIVQEQVFRDSIKFKQAPLTPEQAEHVAKFIADRAAFIDASIKSHEDGKL